MLPHILDSKNPQMLRPAAAVPLTASRRLFLKASAAAGAGLVIGFAFAGGNKMAAAATPAAGDAVFVPNA
ncbi:MAG: twin-arginine translocation signal domain-containing protein, partial [Kiloniellaceae bacterium]